MRTLILIGVVAAGWAGPVAGQRPTKCGLSDPARRDRITTFKAALAPARQVIFISPGGYFAVHYDTTGVHSPDLATTQPDSTPDWVAAVAEALELSRSLLLTLGFDPAPDDGDGVYDAYLTDYGGRIYGETTTIPDIDGGGLTSYLEMDNDFAEDEEYFTHHLDAARVTAAHEYFHAVQFGYAWRPGDVYFYELSSTWFEEVAFPEVNDWTFWYFLDYDDAATLGNNPTRALNRTNGYSAAIFGHYLTKTYDPAIVLRTWERFKSTGALAALGAEVASFGSSLTVVWTDFVARLFFNGRDASQYFHADQDMIIPPDAGGVQLLTSGNTLVFANLATATAGIQALALDGPASLELQVASGPPVFAAHMVLGREDNSFSLRHLTGEPWYEADLNALSTIVLVVGGESGSIEIEATVVDTLRGLAFTLDFLGPNPLVPGRPTHTGLTLRYTVGQALPLGDHRITIYNILGQRLPLGGNLYHWQKIMPVGEGSHDLFLDIPLMRQWPSGVYILRFTLDRRHTFTRTFTILR